MLAHIRNHNGLALGHLIQLINNALSAQAFIIVVMKRKLLFIKFLTILKLSLPQVNG